MVRSPLAQLHSPHSLGALARWNFGLSEAAAWVVCESVREPTKLFDASGKLREWHDPLDALRWMEGFEIGRSAGSRWVGYAGYDLGRLFEKLDTPPLDDLKLPLFAFGFYTPTSATIKAIPARPAVWRGDTFQRSQYLAAVQRALGYIRAGDIFQVNLSQRFTFDCQVSPAELWARATSDFQADFGAFLDFGEFAILSLSPELLLRRIGRDIVTRPIKGTRARAAGLDQQLRDSGKDRAELNMIIDLERNDLGRICEIGSVRVAQPPHVEAHPTVYHGVAEIAGTLRGDVGLVDILRAMFPGGSITGAPKVRAMQIIDELEPVRRGPYCGAIGYLDADGSVQFNVAIRTMVLKDGLAYVPVGGGIVADSDPAAEYEETLVKARAMLGVLGVDEAEFRRRCYGT